MLKDLSYRFLDSVMGKSVDINHYHDISDRSHAINNQGGK